MSNLTFEQIRNLESEGYIVRERGGKTEVVKETDSGTVRYKLENGRVTGIDSYFGDVRDEKAHDRFSSNLDKGTISGHGFDHEKW